MSQIFDFLFGPYHHYDPLDILLELTAVVFGLLSVWYAQKNKLWVYPTGMISTAIYVYLLLKWTLLGDTLINVYYFVMSVYGWFYWSKKEGEVVLHPIDTMSRSETKWALILFVASLLFVYGVYQFFGYWKSWIAYADTFTTGLFFVGMWLMARRKIQHWLFWIVGDLISIPLYWYKGFALTALQYLIFTLIALYGYRSWKKILDKSALPSTG